MWSPKLKVYKFLLFDSFVDAGKEVPLPTHYFVSLARCVYQWKTLPCDGEIEILSFILPHVNLVPNCMVCSCLQCLFVCVCKHAGSRLVKKKKKNHAIITLEFFLLHAVLFSHESAFILCVVLFQDYETYLLDNVARVKDIELATELELLRFLPLEERARLKVRLPTSLWASSLPTAQDKNGMTASNAPCGSGPQ